MLSTALAVVLGALALGVLVATVFALWRLAANVRDLFLALDRMQRRLAPGLEELDHQVTAAAERAARLQERLPQSTPPAAP